MWRRRFVERARIGGLHLATYSDYMYFDFDIAWRGPQREATPRPALMSLGPGAGRSARPAWARAGVFSNRGAPKPQAGAAHSLGTGRVRATVSGPGNETCVSLPFGDGLNCRHAGEPIDPVPMHFTGQEHDPLTGLEHFPARYDSSTWGRFVTPDWSAAPTGVPYASFADPQSLDLYLYTLDNPVTNTDPSGHICFMGLLGDKVNGPPRAASDGCIVLGRTARDSVAGSGLVDLEVVP